MPSRTPSSASGRTITATASSTARPRPSSRPDSLPIQRDSPSMRTHRSAGGAGFGKSVSSDHVPLGSDTVWEISARRDRAESAPQAMDLRLQRPFLDFQLESDRGIGPVGILSD